MKKIAVFYASEGTGHKAAAENIRDWFLHENPDGEALCRDVLDYIPPFLHKIISDGYLLMARHAPWAWGWFYWGSDKPSMETRAFDWFHSLLCKRYLPKIESDVRDIGAEAVVFTHYFGAPYCARRNIDEFPVFYVNTDFICHRFQRDKIYKASFVASPAAVRQHEAEGIKNVFDTGIPVSPKFAALPARDEARARLRLNPTDKIILVSGGGIGAGSVLAVVDSLARRGGWRTIVICGNNKTLRGKLSSIYRGNGNVRIEGFVSNMVDFYRAADLGVMKPGGLSLAEALAAGLPLLLTEPIPGQEQLNLDYICGLGAARRLKNANNAAEEAAALLEDEKAAAGIIKNIEKISRPKAAKKILEIIAEELSENS